MDNLVQLLSTGVACTDLGVIGSVEDVIAGVVRPDLQTRKINASDYRFGFELASPHGLHSMGESVLVNGNCYTTSTDKNDHYLKTISGETFYTSGIFLVPHAAKSSYHFVHTHHKSGINYQNFCEEIHQTTGSACLMTAVLHFKHLEATCIQKAPVTGQNIFEHKDLYYDNVKLQFDNCTCFLVAAIANFYTDPKKITEELKVVLYQNPFDVKNELNIHTHAVILNRAVRDVSTLIPKDVTHTIHVFNANTIVDEVLWGEVFVVDKVKAL